MVVAITSSGDKILQQGIFLGFEIEVSEEFREPRNTVNRKMGQYFILPFRGVCLRKPINIG